MEIALNYNWNVYKIFKNGKRAKAPVVQFEATEENYIDYFEKEIKQTLSKSLQGSLFKFIRSDLSQERQSEQENKVEEKYLKDRNRVLSRLFTKSGTHSQKPISTALIYYKESDWKWQWAAVESGTSRYIQGLSPKFNTTKEADIWIEEMISSDQ